MTCIAGDTLPTFIVSVEADSLEDCRMQLILAKSSDPTMAAICKECELEDVDGEECFTVTLTSEDTSTLTEGIYRMHFRFIGADGLDRRKLYGDIYVTSAARGDDCAV
jgi:hypothetical protein